MFRFDRLVLTVMLVGVAAVALGAANRIPSFVIEEEYTPFEIIDNTCVAGTPLPLLLDSSATGMAILNYASGAGKTIVQVIVSDFTGAPNGNLFSVRLDPDVGNDLGLILVDSQGNGHFRGEISGDKSNSNVELWQQVQGACPAVRIAYGANGA